MSTSLHGFGIKIDHLSVDERREVIALIAETIVEDPPRLDEAVMRELERRYLDAQANPGLGESWESVRARLRGNQ